MLNQLPFIHAMTGCDTTSRLFGIGKPFALKKIKTQAKVFMTENMSKDVITKAGEEAMVTLYGGNSLEGLDLLRWRKFTAKTMSARLAVSVQFQSPPPIPNAAQLYS